MDLNEINNKDANSGFIGEGVLFKGSITAPDTLVVHGVVEGDITARSVLVGASGSIKGSLKSVDAEIHGKVGDDVEVQDFLHLSPTSRLEGTVSCRDIQIDRGASLKASFISIEEVANDSVSDEEAQKEAPATAKPQGENGAHPPRVVSRIPKERLATAG